ncbi:MAG: hypothetical protein HQM00_01500 [Magnetococcales bacterium]|nr:hypothetical protein [Magnetococcales bacterium]
MEFVINAWLERRDPHIVVSHGASGARILDWDHIVVQRLFATGEVVPEDFLSLARQDVTELVLKLFRMADRLEAA